MPSVHSQFMKGGTERATTLWGFEVSGVWGFGVSLFFFFFLFLGVWGGFGLLGP